MRHDGHTCVGQLPNELQVTARRLYFHAVAAESFTIVVTFFTPRAVEP